MTRQALTVLGEYAGVAVLVLLLAVLAALGFAPVYFWGFAWGLIISAVVGLVVLHFCGEGIEGGYAGVICLVVIATGFALGCAWRYVPIVWSWMA